MLTSDFQGLFFSVLCLIYVRSIVSTPTTTTESRNSSESNEDLYWSSCNRQVPNLQLSSNCSNCTNDNTTTNSTNRTIPAEEIEKLRLEITKIDILQKMQKKGPPCRQSLKPTMERALQVLINIDSTSEEDTDDSKESNESIEKLILFPVNTVFQCYESRMQPCSRFEFLLPDYIDDSRFVSAELELKELRKNRRRPLRVISSSEFNYTWEKLYFNPTNVSRLGGAKFALKTTSSSRNITLETYGSVVAETGSDRPFLLVLTKDKQSKTLPRSRRHLDCTNTTTSCCRQTKYVSFEDWGWDQFVFQPPGFFANYCKGHCFNNLGSLANTHNSIFHTYHMVNETIIQDLGISTCCTPTEFAPLTMIYVEEDGTIVKKTFPNMIVKSCGCR